MLSILYNAFFTFSHDAGKKANIAEMGGGGGAFFLISTFVNSLLKSYVGKYTL
jgi:hypothetical protein